MIEYSSQEISQYTHLPDDVSDVHLLVECLHPLDEEQGIPLFRMHSQFVSIGDGSQAYVLLEHVPRLVIKIGLVALAKHLLH